MARVTHNQRQHVRNRIDSQRSAQAEADFAVPCSLFGYQFNQSRYRQVLEACVLERDLELLPDGEETFVGERGLSLSGQSRRPRCAATTLLTYAASDSQEDKKLDSPSLGPSTPRPRLSCWTTSFPQSTRTRRAICSSEPSAARCCAGARAFSSPTTSTSSSRRPAITSNLKRVGSRDKVLSNEHLSRRSILLPKDRLHPR